MFVRHGVPRERTPALVRTVELDSPAGRPNGRELEAAVHPRQPSRRVLHAEDKLVRNRVQNNVYAAFARDGSATCPSKGADL